MAKRERIVWETQKGGRYKNARRSGDVRPTNLSTSFVRKKKRKEETGEKKEAGFTSEKKKNTRPRKCSFMHMHLFYSVRLMSIFASGEFISKFTIQFVHLAAT